MVTLFIRIIKHTIYLFSNIYLLLIGLLIRNIPKGYSYYLLRKFRYKESKVSYEVRYMCYKKLCLSIGENVKISPGTYISYPENISIGNNVTIHEFCVISGYGGIEIGNDVSIAHNCSILSSSHPYHNPDMKIRESELLKGKVTIGNNVWIGAGVKILYRTRIADGVVIGAGSVVNKNIPCNSVYAGVPAKLIKNRLSQEVNNEFKIKRID